MRLHEHARGRQVHPVASDEAKVALPQNEARHAYRATNRASLMRENERSDHGSKGMSFASVGYNFRLHPPTCRWSLPPEPPAMERGMAFANRDK
jgi:hypothetical protein